MIIVNDELTVIWEEVVEAYFIIMYLTGR